MFLDWTYKETAPYLQCKPELFRCPIREALNMLWEQVENQQIYNQEPAVFDELCDFINQSFDEDDCQDVDFGNAKTLLDAFFGGVAGFFPIAPERQIQSPWNNPFFYESCAASCVTYYAEDLYNIIYENCYQQIEETETFQNLEFMEKHTKIHYRATILAAESTLWKQEIERIQSDLLLIKNYPANKKIVAQRRHENQQLRTLPFCNDGIDFMD